jgi:hypothetical protein
VFRPVLSYLVGLKYSVSGANVEGLLQISLYRKPTEILLPKFFTKRVDLVMPSAIKVYSFEVTLRPVY